MADSGATHLLVKASDTDKLSDTRPNGGLTMTFPNGDTITSTGAGEVRLPTGLNVPAHIFADSELQCNLLSLSHLCNAGCTATLTATEISVRREGTMVLQGSKDKTDALWTMELPAGTTTVGVAGSANVGAREDSTGQVHLVVHNQLNLEFVAWACAVFSTPPTSTMLRALRRGWLSNFPRLKKDASCKPPGFRINRDGTLRSHATGAQLDKSSIPHGPTTR